MVVLSLDMSSEEGEDKKSSQGDEEEKEEKEEADDDEEEEEEEEESIIAHLNLRFNFRTHALVIIKSANVLKTAIQAK